MARPSIGRVAATIALCGLLAAAPPSAQRGAWALGGGQAAVRAELRVAGHATDGTRVVDIAEFAAGSATPITNYRLDQTKLMHLVLVRDDFNDFAHLHPVLRNGHFTTSVRLDNGHRYYLYADSLPASYAQQVFRFVLQSAAPPHDVRTTVWAKAPRVAAGPYSVSVSTLRLGAGKPQTLSVRIMRGGQDARDLHPYLGATAHAVFIDIASLAYVHVHPMPANNDSTNDMDDMTGMSRPKQHDERTLSESAGVPATMRLMVPPLRAGFYKLWLQFRGANGLDVAPFTLRVT